MKHKTWFNLLVVLVCLLAMGGAARLALQARARQVLAQAPVVEGALAPQAAVGTAFTYQGHLVKDSNPVGGACDFQFSLWNASSGGGQVGNTQTKSGVSVSDGYFTVPDLDFGADAFQGDARYLQISVRCPATTGTWAALTGRASLTPAPYAMSLRPGAVISGSVMGKSVLEVSNSYSSGVVAGLGVQGTAQDVGLRGVATASSGAVYGVYGGASSVGGAGVYGTNSTGGKGVFGDAAIGIGVYGNSTSGIGVYGKSTTSYGVYSDGNAHVNGNLTWRAMTSCVSVATSAFIPELYDDVGHVEYDNEGYYLKNEAGSAQWYVAAVQLPHGAVIKNLEVGWHDGSDQGGTVYLERRSMLEVTLSPDTLALVSSVGTASLIRDGVWNDDTIDYATVDNQHYTYYLEAYLPGSAQDVKLYGVVITHEITKPY